MRSMFLYSVGLSVGLLLFSFNTYAQTTTCSDRQCETYYPQTYETHVKMNYGAAAKAWILNLVLDYNTSSLGFSHSKYAVSFNTYNRIPLKSKIQIDNKIEVQSLDRESSKTYRLAFFKLDGSKKYFDYVVEFDPKDQVYANLAFCRNPALDANGKCETTNQQIKLIEMFDDPTTLDIVDDADGVGLLKRINEYVQKIRSAK